MALVRWEPRRREPESIRGLREEVDRLFDDFFRGWGRAPWSGRGGEPFGLEFHPRIDLKEEDRGFTLTAELPGLTREDLDVTITEDSVILRGERRDRKEERGKEGSYHYRETSSGSFRRVIPLPSQIKPDAATARLKDGVLTLDLPKAEPAKARQVKVVVE